MRPISSTFRRWAILCCATIVATTFAAVLPGVQALAAPSSWSVAPTVNQGITGNQLNSVSCGSATNCMAVGSYSNSSGQQQTLAEWWHNGSWQLTSTPDPGTTGNQLNHVSCVGGTFCMAVGTFINSSDAIVGMALKWNGSTWTSLTIPNPSTSDNQFQGLSCASTTNCEMVGSFDNGITGDVTLAELWNGSTWTQESTPTKGTGSSLHGVSCVSATNCMAVGRFISTGTATLTEKWNGTNWTVKSSPNPGGHNDDELLDVSCGSGSACATVGDFFNGTATETLTETWNGTTWTHTTSPNPSSTDNGLDGVACTAATSCETVGFDESSSGTTKTLVEKLSGSTWKVQSSPSPSTADNALSGVSCTSGTNCMAAGQDDPGATGQTQTLAETWDGTSWFFMNTLDQNGSFNVLDGVSCTGASSCMSGGFFEDSSGVDQSLIESWNGSTWSVIPSADEGNGDNILNGISCSSSSSCIAVGFFRNSGVQNTLALVWNGSTWSPTTTQDPGSTANQFSSVSCVSSTDCIAAGWQTNGSTQTTLAELWNGATWSTLTPTNPSSSFDTLASVSCPRATFCSAVGIKGDGPDTLTLTESWNGTTWKTVTSPNPGAADNVLDGVSCTGPSACQAVGRFDKNSVTNLALIESWNGSSWKVVSTPQPDPDTDQLLAVSCSLASNCVAVGLAGAPGSRTFADSWNGLTWIVPATPNAASADDQFQGVSCPTAATCQAVGLYSPGGAFPDQTLAETASTQPPVLKSFSPTSGKVGTKVTITGQHLSGVTSVTFNGKAATISSETSTTVVVKVPAGATTGKIKVTSPGGSATSTKNFTVT